MILSILQGLRFVPETLKGPGRFPARPRRALLLLPLALALVAAGCASSTGGSSSRGSANVLDRETLASLERLTVYQAVQRLRPQWLSTRGADSFYSDNSVQVYVDDARVGGVEELRRYSTLEVDEVRFLDSRQATTRFGLGHPSGAIMVRTRRGA